MTGHFRYYLRVRYSECDAQKVVFNARYAEYMDIAAIQFLRAVGFGPAFMQGPLDFQLVKQTIEWKAAARYDQVLELAVHCTHLGNTSFTLAAEFRVAGQERLIVNVETVYVLVQADSLRKISLPDDLRAALSSGAPGKKIDHAGYAAD